MKISSREKYLLGILIAVLISLGYYQLIYINQSEKVRQLKNEKIDTELKYNNIMATINTLDEKEEELKVLSSKIYDKSKELYPDIIQEKLILELDALLKESNIKGSINFSEISAKPIEVKDSETKNQPESSLQQYVSEYNKVNTSDDNDTNNVTDNIQNNDSTSNTNETINNNGALNIQQIKVTLNYRGSYDDLTSLINNIEIHEKKIVLSNLTMNLDGGGEVSGTLSLDFYSVPKIDKEDEDYFKWNISNQYGKSNPFDISALGENANLKVKDDYDFILATRSSKSDLATVSIAYAKDKSMKGNVYADSDGVEDVEIQLLQSGDKYYYKYKTSKESNPKNYTGDKNEFKPLGNDIVLEILSDIRINSEDNSGMNLKVINNTDKSVDVRVRGDDTSRPRVTVSSEGMSVNVSNIK